MDTINPPPPPIRTKVKNPAIQNTSLSFLIAYFPFLRLTIIKLDFDQTLNGFMYFCVKNWLCIRKGSVTGSNQGFYAERLLVRFEENNSNENPADCSVMLWSRRLGFRKEWWKLRKKNLLIRCQHQTEKALFTDPIFSEGFGIWDPSSLLEKADNIA